MSTKPTAVFMAFGTKGDVYPIAAIAAAFACDQQQYHVVLVTHSAHENLRGHLSAKNVAYAPVSSPPVLSPHEDSDSAGLAKLSFLLKKREITRKHRQECVSAIEGIFEDSPRMEVNGFQMSASVDDSIAEISFNVGKEGWSLAELFHVRCVVAAPYVVPYSAPSSFERLFRNEHPHLYKYLQEAPIKKVCWQDVIHWMWPLFTEEWGSWRSVDLRLSLWPFTDPVTDLPVWHDRATSPLLLYGFSKEVVECPGYWPSNVRACGFWFLPVEWQFSCNQCAAISTLIPSRSKHEMCSAHFELHSFLETSDSLPPVFVGLSSAGSMGFLKNPQAFLQVLQAVLEMTSYRFILLSANYEPLDAAIQAIIAEASSYSERISLNDGGISLFGGRLFFFSGTIPYNWLFPRCVAAIHHGGSGSTAAALHAGIPQVLCPFMLDQFYWAERMFWLGVAPEPLRRNHLVPDKDDDIGIRHAAKVLARAIECALSTPVKARASEIAERLSLEDGVSEAVKILKEEMSCSG